MAKPGPHKAKNESPSTKHGAKKQGGGKGSGKAGGSWKVPGMSGGSKTKDGCLPRILMLLLPFLAVGSFFILKP